MKKLSILFAVCACICLACSEKAEPPTAGNAGPQKPATPKQRQLYISPEGSDENNGLAAAFPLKTFDKVLEVLKPGDVVNIMPGTYRSNGSPIIDLKAIHAGEEGKYITFKAHDPNNRPLLIAGGKAVWHAILIESSYIIIDGLELQGHNAQIDSTAAYECANNHNLNRGESHDWSITAQYNTNGISILGDRTSASYIAKHIIVRNCEIHDFPGCGVSGIVSDYVTFENNVIYNNAWYTMYGCSGISFLNPADSDDETGYKMIIRGNKCFNNMTKIPWFNSAVAGFFRYSDGNGIIIDVNNDPKNPGGPYKGRTLVCNNLSVSNGGSGIHAFKADHVDIINNTAAFNGKKYKGGEYADIYAHNDADVNIVNNIMYSRPASEDGECNKKGDAVKKIIYENNLCFNGKVYDDPAYFIDGEIADPMFVNPTEDIKTADYHLQPGSPAAGMGVSKPYMPETDLDGRKRGEKVCVGAYYSEK